MASLPRQLRANRRGRRGNPQGMAGSSVAAFTLASRALRPRTCHGMRGRIFISYRRDDAPGEARGVADRLARDFGKTNVFMDVDNLLAGQRFDRELDRALSQCDVLIAILGPRWMELLSRVGGKRDFVRDEIAAALKRDIVVYRFWSAARGICRRFRRRTNCR